MNVSTTLSFTTSRTGDDRRRLGKGAATVSTGADLDANNPKADQGLRLAQRAVEKEAEIKERLADADALMAQGDYRGAADEYIAITDFAVATPRILKFHSQLEQKRNQALDLHNWQTRAKNTQAEIRKAHAQNDWETAAKVAEDMLRQLPQEPVYQPLRSELENARANALSQGDHQALLRKAEEALRAREFEQGIMLLENIPQNSPSYSDAQKWLRQARSYLDTQKRDLQAIETAIAETRWTDALAQLEQWRGRYQEVPLWQQLYLQAGMAYGRMLLETGRQHNQQRAFDQAGRQFESAQKAFEEVLKIYPTNLDAAVARRSGPGFYHRQQASASGWIGPPHEAAQSLKWRNKPEHARSEGRDYTPFGAVVNDAQPVIAVIRPIEEDAARLRNAESWGALD
jgi:ribosomal protein L22